MDASFACLDNIAEESCYILSEISVSFIFTLVLFRQILIAYYDLILLQCRRAI